jgi:hypothetical protein
VSSTPAFLTVHSTQGVLLVQTLTPPSLDTSRFAPSHPRSHPPSPSSSDSSLPQRPARSTRSAASLPFRFFRRIDYTAAGHPVHLFERHRRRQRVYGRLRRGAAQVRRGAELPMVVSGLLHRLRCLCHRRGQREDPNRVDQRQGPARGQGTQI